jgi:putative selenate reductase
LNFDTIIPAIGQDKDIDFVDIKLLKTGNGGYETKLKNVFIGGDALRGASTAINAIADGRKAAEEIILKSGQHKITDSKPEREEISAETLMVKKASKIYPQKSKELPLNQRHDFSIVEKTFTEEEAIKEASRCLLCDEVCNICTTVCPNSAFHSFVTEPGTYNTEKITSINGDISITDNGIFEIKQKYQILHIADWCNECGNCSTFCPSAGKPYRDKPHLYLTKSSFEENKDGFYFENNVLLGYFNKEKYSFQESGNGYLFENKSVSITIDKQTFKATTVKTKENTTFGVSLKFAAEMKVVFEGAKSFWG